jgi:hypothetical protein
MKRAHNAAVFNHALAERPLLMRTNITKHCDLTVHTSDAQIAVRGLADMAFGGQVAFAADSYHFWHTYSLGKSIVPDTIGSSQVVFSTAWVSNPPKYVESKTIPAKSRTTARTALNRLHQGGA